MKREDYIGIFDSGIGGLTVMSQIIQRLPHENLFYFGDTARVPYGGKSAETIRRYVIENVLYMMERPLKALVIACNTATTPALEPLSRLFKVPVLGVIQPGVEACLQKTKGRIGVIATQSTINSQAYQKELKKRLPEASIFATACPLFVPLAEERFWNHPVTREIAKEYLHPLREQKIDTLLLGCTHYPLLKEIIQETMGPDVMLIDSASTCADFLLRYLQEHQLENTQSSPGMHIFAASDDPERFQRIGETFLKMPISSVELASPSIK
jgi:glutamate racemase